MTREISGTSSKISSVKGHALQDGVLPMGFLQSWVHNLYLPLSLLFTQFKINISWVLGEVQRRQTRQGKAMDEDAGRHFEDEDLTSYDPELDFPCLLHIA